jgi:hypothetical protein
MCFQIKAEPIVCIPAFQHDSKLVLNRPSVVLWVVLWTRGTCLWGSGAVRSPQRHRSPQQLDRFADEMC